MAGRGVLSFIVAFVLLAAPASAGTRYAEPGGDGPAGTCPAADPCGIETAVESFAVGNGDEILLAPGTYNLGTGFVNVDKAITLRPRDPGDRPVIQTTGTFAVAVQAAATVRDLELASTVASGTSGSLFVNSAAALVERLLVRTSFGSGTQFACAFEKGTIRDSVCAVTKTGTGGTGVALGASPSTSGALTTNAINVTAYARLAPGATGFADALSVEGIGPDRDPTLAGRNVIARGGAVRVTTNGAPGASATLSLSNSNFETPTLSGAGTSATPNTAPGNQSAPPLLADPAAGDFHQLDGSPTRNAGAPDPQLGQLDFENEPRVLGSAPDIGADEFEPSQWVIGPGGTTALKLTVDSKPKRKLKTGKRRTRFSIAFSANEPAVFHCSLDNKTASTCTSPFSGKVKKGKHTVAITALDAAGNLATKVVSWTVKRRKPKNR